MVLRGFADESTGDMGVMSHICPPSVDLKLMVQVVVGILRCSALVPHRI